MKKRKVSSIGAVAMATMLAVQGMGLPSAVFAAEKPAVMRSDSNTQMSSEKETVYVNQYGSVKERSQNFDSNWRFYLGDAAGAEQPTFDDSKWRQLSLPHDYSIEQEYTQAGEAESAYLLGGTGWYRKNFTLGKEMEGKEFRIDFDGVYMNATVYVNGQEVGTHPYGYTPFSFDITDYVNVGEVNTIAVKVDHKTPSSRWYSGSGIYRSVYLTTTDKVHVDLNGVKVETPKLAEGNQNTDIKTTVLNESEEEKTIIVTHTMFEKGTDKSVGTVTTEGKTVAAGQRADVEAVMNVKDAKLWSPESPNLYTVRTEVKVGEDVVDTYETDYGFRYFSFDTEEGFSLNGKNVKLKGVCMHHDQGALGSEANRRAIERQVEILQEMGCNSIRVTHNPAASELIDICNEKGMIVIDEFFDGWMYHKNGNSNDYATWFNKTIEEGNEILGAEDGMTWAEFDLKATVGRGQNAPSIIMWSLGNEIQEGTAGGNGYDEKAADLIKWTQEVDDTRILTIGSNAVKNAVGNPSNEHIQIANQLTAVNGASGTNYSNGNSYDRLHETYPEWNLYGSETASAVNSRGVYTTKQSNKLDSEKQLTSYDKSAVSWGAVASSAWYDVITKDFVAGEYVWTGFDYLGEPTPANGTDSGAKTAWPSPKNSYFGIVDTAGLPKDSYYFYQSQWNDDVNTLHVLPTWNEDSLMKDKDGKVEVVVYSDAAKVDLKLNGKVVGTQEFEKKTTDAGYTYQTVKDKSGHTSMYMTFEVPYEAGTLEAVAYNEKGEVIKKTEGRSVVKTAGEAKKLKATADRKEITADGKDLVYVTVDVTDKDGNIVPNAKNNVKFDVKGGTLVGVDNGKQADHQSYQDDNRDAYNGSLVAIVEATDKAGEISVTASSKGLDSATVNVAAKSSGEAEETHIESFEYSRVFYVKTGEKPMLPAKIKANYSDGTSKDIDVKWGDVTDEQTGKAGSFVVGGTAEGCNVSVVVNMIHEVAALLNYSTTTSQNTKPALPTSRQAVMPDGTILSAAFPVTWEQKEASAYEKPGEIVRVNGTADVFGSNLDVTATVRVAEEKIEIGDSVSGAAKLTQDIEPDKQSDTLEAIKNGSTTIGDNNDGGANEDCWSNWKNSVKNGDKDAEITFEYATQQRIGQIVIHFSRDNAAMKFPTAGSTEIYVSETGTADSWTKVEATEIIGAENNRVKAYTYEIAPTTATFVKFKVVSPADKKCVGITEIELKQAVGKFITNTTAKLAEVKIAGKAIPEAALSLSSYSTPETDASKVEAKTADNAALTVLPVKDKVIRMIMESEDHNVRNRFEVRLDEEESILPGDDSKDYPVAQMAATAASELNPASGVEGPASFVLDNNPKTHWHTNWKTNEATNEAKRAITLEMKPKEGEEYPTLDGLRYLRRQGNSKNGAVTEYKVECSMDGSAWKTVSTGTWDKDNADWQIALFDEPVQAKYVRLTGVHTYADSGVDAHMSAAELRVRTADAAVDPEPEPGDTEIYDPGKTTATAGSTQANFGPEKALDNNMGTWWHSSWNPEGGSLAENLRWFQMELDEPQTITKFIYTPKNGNSTSGGEKNGTVTKYRVECSDDGEAWKAVSEGDWAVEDGAKEAVLETPTTAKFIRLVGVETYGVGNQTNKFMSAAEVRVEVQTGETPDPTLKEFSVTFNINGTTQVVKVEEGKAIGDKLPADPTKEGYTFTGWNTKADGIGDAVTEDTVVSEDMTVYAVFKENATQFTVTFNVDETTQEVVVEEGSAIGDKLPADPTKDGYTFVGWNTKADGTGDAVTKETVVNADMTVYAVFEKNEEPPKPETADKSDLVALIEYANSQKEQEEYQWVVKAVKEAFEKALTDAEAVNADASATQEQVDAAYELLLGRVHLLGFIGNPTDLKVTLDLAKKTSTEGKTEESVAVLNAAIAKAEEMLASGNALQEELDAMVAELKVAIEGLKDEVVVEVDKAKLLELIKKAEDYDLTKYTPVTAEGLRTALAGAKTVYDNPKATQKEVDSAYASLQQAIFDLRLIPNKGALEELIKETEKIDFSLYTAESAEAVQKAYDRAVAVFNDENADQAAVDKAAKELKVAKDNLKAKAAPSTKPSEEQKSNQKSAKTGDNMSTGAIVGIVVLAVLAIGAIVGVIISKKRKK
ncbi:MAG: discoidin domain-containing protein [Clostridiales bacterium]|nr:discoidin domain-containing protein [Clostridiales bacterium]